mmetsp:Transcript_876/g.2031  ORF Transcript_876/g.2031 Transcript_876/m.2031 type:complete len:220 (-) Transcript_876:1054-1713(-)
MPKERDRELQERPEKSDEHEVRHDCLHRTHKADREDVGPLTVQGLRGLQLHDIPLGDHGRHGLDLVDGAGHQDKEEEANLELLTLLANVIECQAQDHGFGDSCSQVHQEVSLVSVPQLELTPGHGPNLRTEWHAELAIAQGWHSTKHLHGLAHCSEDLHGTATILVEVLGHLFFDYRAPHCLEVPHELVFLGTLHAGCNQVHDEVCGIPLQRNRTADLR